MVEGDHKITDESVDEESKTGLLLCAALGCHERDVTPASCPINKASNVIENCSSLWRYFIEIPGEKFASTYFPFLA